MTYRSAEDALRERTHLLAEELRTLEQRRRESARLDREAAALRESLAKSRTLLERFEQKRALPMLDQVRVASPCSARWDEMVGDEKSRFCGKCEKNVYNLSAMSREDAELLMLEKEGNLCVRLYRRADGTVLTQDCPVGVRKKRLRLVGVLAIGGGLAATAAGFAANAFLHGDQSAGHHEGFLQGEMVATPPPRDLGKVEMGDVAPAAPTAPHTSPKKH